MNLGKRLIGLLIVTGLFLFIAWGGLKIMQTGGNWETIWQEMQRDWFGRLHGPIEFYQKNIQPRVQEAIPFVQEQIEKVREFTGKKP